MKFIYTFITSIYKKISYLFDSDLIKSYYFFTNIAYDNADNPDISEAVADTSDGLYFIVNNIGAIKVPPPLPKSPANIPTNIPLIVIFIIYLYSHLCSPGIKL